MGNIGSFSFLSPQVLPALVLGVGAAAIFAYRQFHMKEAFLELRILANRNYALSVAGSMLLYLVMMGSSIIMPLYVQNILGHSATLSGLVVLPGSLAMAVFSPFAGKLYDKIGMKPLFVTGALCMIVSSGSLFFITMNTSVWVAGFWNVIRCVAIGCLMMPLVTWGTSFVKPELTAHATALLTSLRTIAGAMGTAVFVGIMNVTADHGAAVYGENAPIHGLNVTFLFMGAASVFLLLTAVFGVKSRPVKRKRKKQ